MRIACLLAIALVLAAVGTLAAPRTEVAPRGTPAAFVDLGGIFGNHDENEPDENEPDDDRSAQRQPAGEQTHGRSGISLPVALLGVVAGAIVALFVANRLRRLRVRMRARAARR